MCVFCVLTEKRKKRYHFEPKGLTIKNITCASFFSTGTGIEFKIKVHPWSPPYQQQNVRPQGGVQRLRWPHLVRACLHQELGCFQFFEQYSCRKAPEFEIPHIFNKWMGSGLQNKPFRRPHAVHQAKMSFYTWWRIVSRWYLCPSLPYSTGILLNRFSKWKIFQFFI